MRALTSITREILRQVNDEVVENARLVAESMLTGLFRSWFRVERATEFSEPNEFTLEDDPALILDERMTAAHWRYLPVYIANHEILARRYRQYTEYQFIFAADLTPSMGYRWRDVYLGRPGLSENPDFLGIQNQQLAGDYRSTKLFLLKYLLYAFLLSAVRFGFRSRVMFFTLDDISTYAGTGVEFPLFALQTVDEHFLNPGGRGVWEGVAGRSRPFERVFLELLGQRDQSVVVFASDFMDLVHGSIAEEHIEPYLAELKYRHRVAVLQINDPREVNTRYNRDEHPTSMRWAFQRDVESPDEGGLGQQKYYRPPARNAAFVQRCRDCLGADDRIGGRVAEMVTGHGIIMQKFVYGRRGAEESPIEERLQEVGTWLGER